MTGRDNDIPRKARHERKRLILGSPDPTCAQCGSKNVCSLRRIGTGKRTQILCDNCCAKQKPLSQRARKARVLRFAEAGYAEPTCLTCGESDLRAMELHHMAAAANSNLLVPSCGNCHAIESDDQEDLLVDLRLRDTTRRPLALQAAFDFGLASILFLLAAASKEAQTMRTFYGLVAIALIAWATWNIAADQHFSEQFGSDYSSGVPVPVPS